MRELKQLRKSIYESYVQSVGLNPCAHYAFDAPLRPVVPLDAARGGLLLIGAYRSARFQQIDGDRDVPVGDNLGPFENERWFDSKDCYALVLDDGVDALLLTTSAPSQAVLANPDLALGSFSPFVPWYVDKLCIYCVFRVDTHQGILGARICPSRKN